jgi:hypothetical protein
MITNSRTVDSALSRGNLASDGGSRDNRKVGIAAGRPDCRAQSRRRIGNPVPPTPISQTASRRDSSVVRLQWWL